MKTQVKLSDYAIGILYAYGYLNKKNNRIYVVCYDKHFPEILSKETGYALFHTAQNKVGVRSYAVAIGNMSGIPPISDVKNYADFCRGYIECHNCLSLMHCHNKKTGRKFLELKLEIYGKIENLELIMNLLPAAPKKILAQKSSSSGNTFYSLRYKSKSEIADILNWIDGTPRNEAVWKKWRDTLNQI